MSLVRVPSDGVVHRTSESSGTERGLFSRTGDRPRSSSRLVTFREKNRFHAGAGESDRDDDLWLSNGDVPKRKVALSAIAEGVGRGVTNLDSGSIVMKSVGRMELRDALRFRRACSTGTIMVLTVWPGMYGQAVVEGRAVL